ncbi:MAG: DNA-deoxyinosine glycosylase [Gammaproteobacteria bacterium]|nr:DNA-deoxyinosine glycosylase [Gammaproteobacteria bacterium]
MAKKGLAPIINEDTHILILGSLPSDESIRNQQYYSNPGNDFWKLINEIIGEDITTLDYEAKIQKLQEHKIGIWDVLFASERDGSMDSNINNEEINDFSNLKNVAPNLQLVCFNGKKAGEYEQTIQGHGIETKVLPSSSGANRRYSDKRIVEWRSIADFIK